MHRGHGNPNSIDLDRQIAKRFENLSAGVARSLPSREGCIGFPRRAVEATVTERLASIVAQYGTRTAISVGGGSLSYAELSGWAARIAGALRAGLGEAPANVAVLVRRQPGTSAAIVGALKAGKSYVVLDPRQPRARLRELAQDAEVEAVLHGGEAARQAAGVVAADVVRLDIDDLVKTPTRDDPVVCARPSTPAALYYTSGSTGKPKGVVWEHRQLLQFVRIATVTYALGPDDRVAALHGASFAASAESIFGALLNGATLCPYDVLDQGVHRFEPWLSRQRPTVLHIAPALLRRLLKLRIASEELASIRLVITGGASLLRRDVERFWHRFTDRCVLAHQLAGVEMLIATTYLSDSRTPLPEAVQPVGYPVVDTEVLLVGDDGRQVEGCGSGEIVVGSEYLPRGYWRNRELTAARFDPPAPGSSLRAYRTGDLGRRRRDGALELVGRRGHELKVRGHTVHPAEIERALSEVAEISEAAVAGFRDRNGETGLVAYYVRELDSELEPSELRCLMARRLPDYMVPQRLVELAALPRTPSGKVDRGALSAVEARTPSVSAGYTPPRDALEAELCAIWSQVLGIEKIGVGDGFFDLGGTSIQALEMFAELEQRLDVDLAPSTLLAAPTIESLVAAMGVRASRPSSRSLVPVRASGTGPRLFCVHGGGGGVFFVKKLGDELPSEIRLYGLQAAGFDGRPGPYRPVEQIAAGYVAEIRDLQPRGPYHLCGLSFGGLVAWEMARRLVSTGERVDLLALLDTRHPGMPRALHHGTKRFVERLADLRGRRKLALVARQPWVMGKRYVRRTILSLCLLAGRRLPDTWQLRNEYFWPMHARAARRYRPQPYRGNVTLIAARGSSQALIEHWAPLVNGERFVHEVDAEHLDLMDEPAVTLVARHLEAELERAGAGAREAS